MPQERRKSIGYRSFVTCDDPKGVECGAIKKTKINPQKKEQDSSSKIEAVIKEERGKKKEMGIKGITRDRLETPVSFQLLEVSKEAERLNHVISSWSSDSLLRQKQDYIAQDLLKGALDLQNSLVMLGKIQEASSYMMGLARKQKQKLQEGTFDGMVSGVRGFERPLVGGVDECPRNSVDEMRSAVRDSLLRQNVINNPVFEEHYYDHRKMRNSPDMLLLPSTSSSQSSSNFVPSDSSISSSRKKGKNSSVVVKLMGLESFPSSPRKHMEREKILNMEKPVYEIDSPRAKRPHFGDQEGGTKHKSVEELLNLKFKGLLRNTYVNDLGMDSPESDYSFSENCWDDDERPPIVLMKPLRYPCIDLDKPFLPKSQGGLGMHPGYSRGFVQKAVRNEGVRFEMEGYGADFEEKSKSMKKAASLRPQKKQEQVRKASVVEKVSLNRRKGDGRKDSKSSDELRSRDQEKLAEVKIRRHKDGKSVSKNPTSGPQKTAPAPAPPPMLDYRRRGVSERRKSKQPALIPEEKQICNDEIHQNMETKSICREEIDPKGDKNFLFTTVNNRILTRDYDIDSQSTLLRTPEETHIPNLTNDKKISNFDDNLSCYSEITSVSTSECCNADQIDEAQSPAHEVTLITTHENGVAVHHDIINQEGIKIPENSLKSSEKTDSKTLRQLLTPRMKLKTLLLSNPLFMSHLEVLFNIQVNPGFAPLFVDETDQDLENAQLLIDCANEVLQIKSMKFSKIRSPHPRMYMAKSENPISLDGVLEEVCNEIDELRCYLRLVNDEGEFRSDNIYAIIDQDLRFGSKIWGVGWRHMVTQDEIDQVIGEVDKFVLNKLIEEVLSDFML